MGDTMGEAVSLNKLSWETFCDLWSIHTSELKLPHRTSSGHSTTVNNDRHQRTPPDQAIFLVFLQVIWSANVQ